MSARKYLSYARALLLLLVSCGVAKTPKRIVKVDSAQVMAARQHRIDSLKAEIRSTNGEIERSRKQVKILEDSLRDALEGMIKALDKLNSTLDSIAPPRLHRLPFRQNSAT